MAEISFMYPVDAVGMVQHPKHLLRNSQKVIKMASLLYSWRPMATEHTRWLQLYLFLINCSSNCKDKKVKPKRIWLGHWIS